MKICVAVIVLVTLTRAIQAASVSDALLRERLRLEDHAAAPSARITAATQRFVSYLRSARTADEVRRIDKTLKRYCHEIVGESRQRAQAARTALDKAREEQRRERLRRRPASKA